MGVKKEVKRITDEIDKLDKLPLTIKVRMEVLGEVAGYCAKKVGELVKDKDGK